MVAGAYGSRPTQAFSPQRGPCHSSPKLSLSILAPPSDEAQWRAFLTDLAQAVKKDFDATTTTQQSNTSKIFCIKDIKPDKFSDEKHSSKSFRQWSKDIKVLLKHEHPSYVRMLKLAEECTDKSWDADSFGLSIIEDEICDSDAAFMVADENLHDVIRLMTDGTAREIVDTHEGHGCQAWWKLYKRFWAKLCRVLRRYVQNCPS